MTKPFLMTILLAGLVLGTVPGLAHDADECKPNDTWQEVEIFAVRFDHASTGDTLVILKDDPFHDTAVIWEGETIDWKLSCVNCVAGNDTAEFAIADPKFVADLDEMTHEAAKKAPPNSDDPLPPGLQMKRGKPNKNTKGFAKNFFGLGNGKTKKGGPAANTVSSDPIPSLDKTSELWKYGVMVEIDREGQVDKDNCIQTSGNGDVSKFDKDCCEKKALCDYWDPHIYMHGDMDY